MPDFSDLDRRQALVVLGGLGAAVVVAACGSDSSTDTGAGQEGSTPTTAAATTAAGSATSCTLAPEVTQGPYFLTDHPQAANLVGDRKGVPLELVLTVVNEACRPISGAKVDIWHCDAAGEYAGVSGMASAGGSGAGAAPTGAGPPGGPPPSRGPGGAPPGGGGGGGGDAAATRTNSNMWLQGYQTTGADGSVRFSTIYPGWYAGRAVHIHMKVFVGSSAVHTGHSSFRTTCRQHFSRTVPIEATRIP